MKRFTFYKGFGPMSTEFSFKDYALRPIDLIPDDFEEDEDPELTARQVHHDEVARSLDTDDIQIIVAERLSTSLILRARIEEAQANPYRPNERRHMHVSDAAKFGDETEDIIAQVIDELVEMSQAGGVR
jgi:hypothetical protein